MAPIESAEATQNEDSESRQEWVYPASKKAMRTTNPIRKIVDPIVASSVKCGKERGDGKDQISLALGDPSAYPNLPPLPPLLKSLSQSTFSPHTRGYVNACGSPASRAAIAHFHSTPSQTISPDDVIIANGCSGALELALTAMLDEGTCILVPRPGFPLYEVIAKSHGGYVRYYDLKSEGDDGEWECDLESIRKVIAEEGHEKVRGIVINNPSNPCGSVFSEEHLRDLAKLAKENHLVIVSDEVYWDMTFGGRVFHPMGRIAAGLNVPVITASGSAKQFLVPGWRVGWLIIHDCEGKPLRHIKQGIQNLAQVILGASHPAQDSLISILDPSPELHSEIDLWRQNLNTLLHSQANAAFECLSDCHGLRPIKSYGAMYTMVKINFDLFEESLESDDVLFTKKLLEEENVFCLPGTCFESPGYFRVVTCAPEEVLREAFTRIGAFCEHHKRVN